MPLGDKTCLAIRHVPFEDLGAFAPALAAAGFGVGYHDVARGALADLDAEAPDLLVVLGGPIGAYDDRSYPFLKDEIGMIERRLRSGRPLIGICLGAQLIARAAGARVYPAGAREIGFAPITLTEAGRASCLAPFAADPVTLHWHGDTFDLPTGAERLASTALCNNQAFAMGPEVIGFQFHPEAGGDGFEAWLIGHGVELAGAGIDVVRLRSQARRYWRRLAGKADQVVRLWLAGTRLAAISPSDHVRAGAAGGTERGMVEPGGIEPPTS